MGRHHHCTPLSIGGEIRQRKHVLPMKTELHCEQLGGTKFTMSAVAHQLVPLRASD
jgi:hypothetical protein